MCTLWIVAGGAMEQMETNVSSVLQHDTACISALHVLKLYAQRLGCDLNSPPAVARSLGEAFLLVSEALADTALLQFPPSITAAAMLMTARKAQARPEPYTLNHLKPNALTHRGKTYAGKPYAMVQNPKALAPRPLLQAALCAS